jgi:putative hemolysin
MLTEIAIVLALTLINGVLAMSELAIVSSRPARLRPRAEAGSRGAAAALWLAENPGRFLSTVQIGITLVGILSGAFSGATLGQRLAGWLAAQGVSENAAEALGVGGVVLAITYLSLILGELVPKQLALRNPETVAVLISPGLRMLSRITAPVVWVLDKSGRAVLTLLGAGGAREARVTDEEVRTLLTEAHQEGVIEDEERAMLSGVMRLADRSARALMTPRRDVEMIDHDLGPPEAIAEIARIGRTRVPVRRRGTDDVLGVVALNEAFAAVARGETPSIEALLREVPVVSDFADALDVMQVLRATPHHMALVYDEYGNFEGIITSGDILEAITGTFGDTRDEEPAVAERDDGSFLVAGWMPVDEFAERFGMPRDIAGDYETVAGVVLHNLGRLPQLGDVVTLPNWRIEVIDIDDRRVDKVLLSRRTG